MNEQPSTVTSSPIESSEVNEQASPFQEEPNPTPVENNQPHRLLFLIIGFVVLALDQLSKWYVVENIPLNSSQAPIANLYPYFQFSHVANTGVSFGLFSGNNSPMIVVAVVAAIAVFIYALKSPPESRLFYVALGFVFGGIVGNMLDRVRLGHVTDFVNFNLRPLIDIPIADWYVFNIADLALVSGVVILFILSLLEARHERRTEEPI